MAFAAAPRATVEGGPDGLGSSYQWTISNNDASPIVRVEIPHYRASLFFAPKGWTASCTNLAAVGSRDEPGVCTASAASAVDGIAPGRSAQFGMQLGAASVKRGMGEVVIEFADSKERAVVGAVVPIPERWSDKYVSLIGLGIFLVIFMVAHSFRSRKKRRAEPNG